MDGVRYKESLPVSWLFARPLANNQKRQAKEKLELLLDRPKICS